MNKLLYNAQIHTLDVVNPHCSAVLILNGRFNDLGKSEDLLAAYPHVPHQDMEGRVVLPGLMDAHIHLQHYALGLQKVDCETDTRAQCLARVAEKAGNSKPGEWILGHGWNHNNWAEGYGDAGLLDRVAPMNPVYLTAKSLHAGWANSQALSIAGITPAVSDPINGIFIRSADGSPNGILLESAMELLENHIPEPTIDSLADSLKTAQSELLKMGLTAVHDFDKISCFSALQLLHKEHELKLRVMKSIPKENLSSAVGIGLRTGFGDDHLWIGSLKLFADGALGPRTAAMMEPYEGFPENTGLLSFDEDQVVEIGSMAVQNGITLAIHAIRDRANHEVLNGFSRLREFEKQQGLHPGRHRIEHVQLLHPDDLSRLADLNLVASMQPIHQPSDMVMADKFWGSRTRYAYAMRTQLEKGAVLALGSDAPVESPYPFFGIHAAVTRQNADGFPRETGWQSQERLSVEDAILGFTQGPAFASGKEDRLGKIRSGYLADLVVLDQDPFEIHPSGLKDIKPAATMIEGDWVCGIWS